MKDTIDVYVNKMHVEKLTKSVRSKYYDNAMSTSVESICDSFESLLTSCIPLKCKRLGYETANACIVCTMELLKIQPNLLMSSALLRDHLS